MKHPPQIIFEDEHILVVNKPAGFLSIPDRYNPKLYNLKTFFENRGTPVFMVHRLDKDTSGVLCLAKNAKCHKALNQQFESRQVKKDYLCLSIGVLFDKSGLIDRPIAKSQSRAGRMVVHKSGKPSQTQYEVLQEFGHYSLVKAEPLTGRQHQIRVHMSAIGHPLLVDPIYSNKAGFFLSEIKRKYNLGKDREERPLISRTTLHAAALSFQHPETGATLRFEAPLPKDMNAVIRQLEKWA
ncbi:MAG: RluA family pseudouridine synthase, partial [Bacteroidota bacterium]